MERFLFVILPYLVLAVFIIGMAYRIRKWVKTPQPGAVTLFPAPKPGSGLFWNVLKESFLFPDLFRGDKFFWSISWLFHASLALIIIGHLRVVAGVFDRMFISMGMSAEGITRMSAVSGGAAGIIIMVAVAFLILRRLSLKRVREISLPADYIALILILAILITGNFMRFGEHFDLAQTRVFFYHLATFSTAGVIVPPNSMFQIHFLLVQLLIVYIPFSKILHFGGIFFTQTIIQKS
ncbi:MAG: hypothetical protein GY841_05850 [FCB group bacterium]|nr:hypothetical protein [FCB group bacterium]